MARTSKRNSWVKDKAAAGHIVEFFEQCLVHVKGSLAGQPFQLMDWQKKIVQDLFGTKRRDGTRRYRKAYIEVPRKNGKSTFAAGIALYLRADRDWETTP